MAQGEGRKIKFLVDYRGKLTKEQYFTAGQIVDPAVCEPPFDGQALVDDGRAVWDNGKVRAGQKQGAK